MPLMFCNNKDLIKFGGVRYRHGDQEQLKLNQIYQNFAENDLNNRNSSFCQELILSTTSSV